MNTTCLRATYFVAAMLPAVALSYCPVAKAAQALLNVEVPAAKWKAMRLKDLPKNAALALSVETSGDIDVILVHQDELKRFPAAVNPEFQGTVTRRLSFNVTTPRSGNYYVIFDNRQGADARKVRVLIRVERPKPPGGGPPSPGTGTGRTTGTRT